MKKDIGMDSKQVLMNFFYPQIVQKVEDKDFEVVEDGINMELKIKTKNKSNQEIKVSLYVKGYPREVYLDKIIIDSFVVASREVIWFKRCKINRMVRRIWYEYQTEFTKKVNNILEGKVGEIIG